ncbi:NAD-dependent epimerase/dehydratase family protein [Legionella gresilensis]|uniref:NAD-dependent epimerase/dehydratase family protein n=1 Tax=Legionella gresilensis TaxID=91823 RepID=UPI0010410A9B|nr:vitamin K epoxide reductase family protein [Legionella gresilensis]
MVHENNKPIVLITGSSGNIGTILTTALKKDYYVIGFDREKESADIVIDLASESSINQAFQTFKQRYGTKIAAVIHLAAYFDFTGEDSTLYEKVNVKGTRRLLQKLQDFEVERFIYTSTMLVHEPCKPGEKVSEVTPLGPKWVYPESKLKAEQVIEKNHGHVPYLILRLAGLYNDSSCVPTLAHQIKRIYERSFKSYLYAGNIEAGQSFIHEEDLVSLIRKSIEHRYDLPEKEVILAGEPVAVSYKELQHYITDLMHNEKSELINVPKPIAKAGAWLEEKTEFLIPDDFDQGQKPFIKPFMIDLSSDHYDLDIARAKEKLDWQPKHQIKKVLPNIIQNLKNDPENWYEKNKIPVPDWMQTIQNQDPEKIRKAYEKEFRQTHQNFLWAHFLNIALGFWLLSSPFTLGYESYLMRLSDWISGGLLIVLAFICLSWRFARARWICALVGLWVIFAPLAFWAPTAAAYLNGTLVGSLIIGFSVLVRPDIGVAPNAAMEGSQIPDGWDFSPSNWSQRMLIIILAFFGLLISRYMAAYQLGHIDGVWEPFFMGYANNPKNGTEEIITSYLSEAWPVPDAGLGAFVYILEILTGIIGGANRWRTMPWLVLLFGILIVPLGVVSITFIIIQPILLGTWCTLCLIAASAMLIQVPYSLDELIATSVFLWRRWKAGRPILRILFVGDVDSESEKSQDETNFERPPLKVIKDIVSGGVSFPWSLLLCLLVGFWLMFTRLTLDSTGSMANADHIIGSLVITVSVIAFAETARSLRWINLFFGLCLLFTPFIYEANLLQTLSSLLCGGLLILLSFPRGKIYNSYGEWDQLII